MGDHTRFSLRITVGDTTVEASSSHQSTLYEIIDEGMKRLGEISKTAKR